MKNKRLIIGLLIVALVIVFAVFAKPYKTPAPVKASAEQSFDPEALAIRDRLYAKSKEYGAKTKRQLELLDAVKQLELEKISLADAAAGYDRVLCADFSLSYTRPGETGSGALVKGCTGFTEGMPEAQ